MKSIYEKLFRLHITVILLMLACMPLYGSDDGVPANVRISPNGTYVAVPAWSSIAVYDTQTHEKLSTFMVPNREMAPTSSVFTFSTDDSLIASRHKDRIFVWDVTEKQIRTKIDKHTESVTALALSPGPNPKFLAAGTVDWQVRLWDAQTGAFLRKLTGHPSAVNAVAFSPDGKTLASAGSTLQLWDVATGELRHADDTDLGSIAHLVFSPDGKTLASSGWDFTVRFWDARTGTLKKTLNAYTDEVRSIAFSPDSQVLATASMDKTIRFWEVTSGSELKHFPVYRDIESALYGNGGIKKTHDISAIQFTADGKSLLIATRIHTLHVLDIETGDYKTPYFNMQKREMKTDTEEEMKGTDAENRKE